MFRGKISWNVVVEPNKPRPIVLVAVLVLLGGLALFFWLSSSNFATILFILFGVFLAVNYFVHNERSYECAMDSHSIYINDDPWHYSDFEAFAFDEPDRFLLRKVDSEDTVSLPVHAEDAEEMWYLLSEMFEEYRYEPTLSDVLTSLFYL